MNPKFPVYLIQDDLCFWGIKLSNNNLFKLALEHWIDEWGLWVLSDVFSESGLHVVVTDQRLEVIEELETLFIRHSGEWIIRVVVTNLWIERRVVVGQAIAEHILGSRDVSEEGVYFWEIIIVENSTHDSLLKDCEAFVEPEIGPVFTCQFVSSPWVSNFVDSNINLWFVPSYDGGWGKSEKWVFHASHREGWWQHKNWIVAPNVWCKIFFSSIKEDWKLFKLPSNCINLAWLSNDTGSTSERSIFKISDRDCNKIWRHLNFVFKSKDSVSVISDHSSFVSTHFYNETICYSNWGVISDFDCWCILHGCNWPASNILALGKEIRHSLTSSLSSSHPGDSGSVFIGCV